MRYRIITILLCTFAFHNAFAQILPTFIDETELQFKVKQIDEFMQRFNGDIQYDGTRMSDSLPRDIRLKNMYTLFDLEKFPMKDGAPDSTMSVFCNYVIGNNYRLCYEDSTWQAEVVCNAMFKNQKTRISLTLHTEQIKDVLYHWVLTDVKSPLFNDIHKETKDSLFISPAEHGISFITLPRIINLSVTDVNTIFHKNWHPDILSIFYYLISSNLLKLQSVDHVIYHFNLGKYEFDVERVERDKSHNSGWLISKLKIKEQELCKNQ